LADGVPAGLRYDRAGLLRPLRKGPTPLLVRSTSYYGSEGLGFESLRARSSLTSF